MTSRLDSAARRCSTCVNQTRESWRPACTPDRTPTAFRPDALRCVNQSVNQIEPLSAGCRESESHRAVGVAGGGAECDTNREHAVRRRVVAITALAALYTPRPETTKPPVCQPGVRVVWNSGSPCGVRTSAKRLTGEFEKRALQKVLMLDAPQSGGVACRGREARGAE